MHSAGSVVPNGKLAGLADEIPRRNDPSAARGPVSRGDGFGRVQRDRSQDSGPTLSPRPPCRCERRVRVCDLGLAASGAGEGRGRACRGSVPGPAAVPGTFDGRELLVNHCQQPPPHSPRAVRSAGRLHAGRASAPSPVRAGERVCAERHRCGAGPGPRAHASQPRMEFAFDLGPVFLVHQHPRWCFQPNADVAPLSLRAVCMWCFGVANKDVYQLRFRSLLF